MNFCPERTNDLWFFDGKTWTWMSGSSSANQLGSYGEKGEPLPSNIPGARNAAISWTDKDGNLWMFGGGGYDEISIGIANHSDILS
jgi:hypothetical protein